MTALEKLKNDLEDVKAKIIKLQTLKEQAQQECARIEQEFGVTSIEELQQKYDEAVKLRDEKIAVAEDYLNKIKEELIDV